MRLFTFRFAGNYLTYALQRLRKKEVEKNAD